jgi:hypothetical protein
LRRTTPKSPVRVASGRLGPWGSSAPRGTPVAFPSLARESLVLRPEGRLNLTVATVGGATHRPAVRRPDPSALLAGAPTRISRSNASAPRAKRNSEGGQGRVKAMFPLARRVCPAQDGRTTSMEFPVMSRASGPSAPGCPPVHWHRHRSHGAHVCGLIRVRRSKQPAAYARKVPLNRHLLERPSRTGLPGRRAVSSQLEPHAGPILR